MNNITEFTICLHCGCSREVVDAQMNSLQPLESEYEVYWNNRIDRHPEIYTSYSELINHSVATSPTEWVILINDRTNPKVDEVKKMLQLLETDFSCVLLYNVGFMGFSKELIRKIGWWDQRFVNGGWEDRDWVWRIIAADLAIYESQEAEYDNTWKSPLNIPGATQSTPHWVSKYKPSPNKREMYKLIGEETYEHWDELLGSSIPEIRNSWKTFKHSILNIDYNKPGSGPSASTLLKPYKSIKDLTKR